jgi:hypothetical protein
MFYLVLEMYSVVQYKYNTIYECTGELSMNRSMTGE